MREEVSAGGIIYKKSGKQILWLVTQHSQHKGWVFPKGLTSDHDGEDDFKITALREVREEGGIVAKIVNDQPFTNEYIYTFKGEKVHKKVYYFLMEYVSGSELDHDFEVSDALWLPEKEVLEKLTFKNDKINFKEAVKTLEGLQSCL